VTFTKLLSHLVSKDFSDEADETSGFGAQQRGAVVLFGVQQLLALITPQLLSYPSLCSEFFTLVGLVIEHYAEKVASHHSLLHHSLLHHSILHHSLLHHS
jgi:hypothetical protein